MTDESNVFIVLLRRPRNAKDSRDDPFYEYGSFGLTGCHSENLLHFKRCRVKPGARLAFIQGGRDGSRLVLVTPPVQEVYRQRRAAPKPLIEVRWTPTRPLKYGSMAPLVTDMPALQASLDGTRRATSAGKLSSKFRSRSRPLEAEIARELCAKFDAAVANAKAEDFARNHADAVPGLGKEIDRFARYKELRRLARGAVSDRRGCR